MGILGNTASICYFTVEGSPPTDSPAAWGGECLARHGFRSIEKLADETSVGWVHLDDPRESHFSPEQVYRRDHYLAFTLRKDQRRLPAPLVKAHIRTAEGEFLAANPGLRRVPKAKREEIRETVRLALLARTLPSPATWDAVWDTEKRLVLLSATGTKAVDLFDTQFRKTFPGLRLVPLHPFARGLSLLDGGEREALSRANRATSEGVLSLLRDNRWLGEGFLLWLLYRSLNGLTDYRTAAPGPLGNGEPFSAYLDDRLVLQSSGEAGAQKVTVSGPQDRFTEVKAAVAAGKSIADATIYLEKDEHAWKMTLKGETFTFGSFRSPKVQMERDELTSEAEEREAVFFERMYLVEAGIQLFDSLYRSFLAARLSPGWPAQEKQMGDWFGA